MLDGGREEVPCLGGLRRRKAKVGVDTEGGRKEPGVDFLQVMWGDWGGRGGVGVLG